MMNWYGSKLEQKLTEDMTEGLYAVALAVEGQAKVNIMANDQIDTGFMLNATYTLGAGSSRFSPIAAPRRAYAALPGQPAKLEAIVGNAAVYSLYQELKQSFLWRALEQVASHVGGIITSRVSL